MVEGFENGQELSDYQELQEAFAQLTEKYVRCIIEQLTEMAMLRVVNTVKCIEIAKDLLDEMEIEAIDRAKEKVRELIFK